MYCSAYEITRMIESNPMNQSIESGIIDAACTRRTYIYHDVSRVAVK